MVYVDRLGRMYYPVVAPVGACQRIVGTPINLTADVSQATAAIDAEFVQVVSDQDILIAFGSAPVADATYGVIHLAGEKTYKIIRGQKVAVAKRSVAGVAQLVAVDFV